MTRTIETIKQEIIQDVTESIPELSVNGTGISRTSEWRLWTGIFATAIHAFEFILDLFRKEMDELTDKITPGTVRWYAEMAKRFQNGDTLVFDEKTAMLHYPKEDLEKRIIAAVAVMEGTDDEGKSCLFIKVAKKDKATEKILELNDNEKYNFERYMEAVKFAGVQLKVSSTHADLIRYKLKVYHDPAIPKENIDADIRQALNRFKTEIDFNGILYRQKFIDAVMGVNGVVTCILDSFSQHSPEDLDDAWNDIDTYTELKAGYFDYADEKDAIQTESINQLISQS